MNFLRVLSKTSLKSASSGINNQDITKLQSEIELLRQTVDSLKASVESRDAAIGTLAREKEKIYIELKSAQRTNRNLHQQLIDERDIHSKEKEFFIDEIKRLMNQNENAINASHNKDACESIVQLVKNNGKSLDSLLRTLLKTTSVPPSSKMYLKLLQINANLHYENTQLKISLSSQDNGKRIVEANCLHCCSIRKQEMQRFKSEGKLLSPIDKRKKYIDFCSYRPSVYSNLQLLNSHNSKRLDSFKYIYQTLGPLPPRNYMSFSDSCINKMAISESLKIKNIP